MNKIFKRIVCVILATAVAFTLCSCEISFKKLPKIPSMNFTTSAVVKYKSYDVMTCTITSVEDEAITVEVTRPEILSGLKLVCSGDSCTIKYGALSYDADTGKYPQLAFADNLKQAIESAKENPDVSKTDDGNWSLHTVVNGSDVWTVLDGETSYPLSMKIPSDELEMTFTDFTETDK
ncbi:MAG: hypothetical protein IJU39_03295 [Clostridia bacterium]|nr:hypothetical protein [Clostridia bacterium]